MNILFVNMSVDPVLGGGTVERSLKLATELQKLPDTKAKILSTTAGLKNPSELGLEFILLPCLSQRWYIPAPYFQTIYKALKWADVVVIIGHWTLMNAMVYWVNRIVKRPYLFCPAGALHIFGRSSLFKHIYHRLVGHAIVDHANRMIAIPYEEKNFFCSLGIEKKRIAIIPNGISPKDFEYAKDDEIRVKYHLGHSPFLLFMGRLNEIKGPDILLKSFIKISADFPNWQLVFAGPDGGLKESLQQTVEASKLSNRIHFIGFISGKEKSAMYHAASLLVIPSRLEAMSIVALEAGICGTPVVMTDVCGFSELSDAEGAIEVPLDSEILADSLSGLMGDFSRLKKMGENAKAFIRMNYTWEIAAIKHRQLCVDVLKESKQRNINV